MAVLSKIRERSMFLIIIIGLALFAFVLDPSTLGDFFNSSKVNEIGEIDGEVISRQEFANELENYKQQTSGRVSEMQAAKTVWDNIVRKKIYKNQLEEAGVTIGEVDVWNEVVNASFVQSNPQYQNEAGLFDESKLKQFLATEKENKTELWSQWSSYMNQIRDNAETSTYNSLVSAGLGASLKEGETAYMIDNTKLNAQFVYVPYTSIADSLVKIKKSEVQSYIDSHKEDFRVEASRDISYVQFDINATAADEELMKSDVESLIADFKTTTNDELFLAENDSDTSLNQNYQFKNFVNQEVADKIFEGNKGDVIGVYKDKEFLKISKIIDVVEMPDSVRASHILIPFMGSQRVTPDVTRTEEEAKNLADSLLAVVKRRGSQFGDLAKEFSSDKGSGAKEGDLDWFNYQRMTPAFRDYAFTAKKGDMEVVQSPFGFHIIKIDDQKNNQKVLKLATFGRKIVASEDTENAVFRQAEEFALAVSKENKFFDAAKDENYKPRPVVGLKSLDENVPGLGNQRQIVSWAFNTDTDVNSFKRFDLEGSHVVAFVTGSEEKGLMSVAKAISTVRPILMNEKKAAILSEKLKGTDLQEIAKSNNTNVRTSNNVTLKSPTLSGVGVEPKVVGAMYNAALNKVYSSVEGDRGVYAFMVTNREFPTALPNYDANRKRISEARKGQTFKLYEAIKKSADIEDNRAVMYSN
ncbi:MULTISPECIES: peptidylprolyl isomerase [unclassified Polaribacter]|uniref:peptidylprolyl isomerase n=1 Tax=unclassified Polaribacter TaxID=196858 RepID=UPI0011BE77F0|nr:MULTISPECIES: peptidylprolyl isomerase [unclassified Polaribacter]TXD51614.1 peptidylprolyl isomerase [Polaribacter sp. IC063]TXD58774.1 peptidylprolyl isomerase [Polaribacter sp. IC066]